MTNILKKTRKFGFWMALTFMMPAIIGGLNVVSASTGDDEISEEIEAHKISQEDLEKQYVEIEKEQKIEEYIDSYISIIDSKIVLNEIEESDNFEIETINHNIEIVNQLIEENIIYMDDGNIYMTDFDEEFVTQNGKSGISWGWTNVKWYVPKNHLRSALITVAIATVGSIVSSVGATAIPFVGVIISIISKYFVKDLAVLTGYLAYYTMRNTAVVVQYYYWKTGGIGSAVRIGLGAYFDGNFVAYRALTRLLTSKTRVAVYSQ